VSNIWVMNAVDGSAPRALAGLTQADSFQPVWSQPDGKKIAFASDRNLNGLDQANLNNTANIWVVNVDPGSGASASHLTGRNVSQADSEQPVWSPDGSQIAFMSRGAFNGDNQANTAQNIWVINLTTLSANALTKFTVADSFDPVWSPDGKRILF